MIEKATNGGVVRFVDDQRGTFTASADLARALVALVRERAGGRWHVANTGVASWYDLAVEVGRCVGRPDDFATAIATSDLDPAPVVTRPAFSALDSSKFASAYGPMPSWNEALARVVRDRRLS
jgi:dTDP-4-dehydrorhamnose reductase